MDSGLPRLRSAPGMTEKTLGLAFDQDLAYVEEESARHRRKAAVHRYSYYLLFAGLPPVEAVPSAIHGGPACAKFQK